MEINITIDKYKKLAFTNHQRFFFQQNVAIPSTPCLPKHDALYLLNHYPLAIPLHHCRCAVQWITEAVDQLKIHNPKHRPLNKLVNPQLVAPIFWSNWFGQSGIKQIIQQTVPKARLLRQVTFIEYLTDQTSLALSAEITLMARQGMQAFWLELTPGQHQSCCAQITAQCHQQAQFINVQMHTGSILAWSVAHTTSHYHVACRQQRIGMLLVLAPSTERG